MIFLIIIGCNQNTKTTSNRETTNSEALIPLPKNAIVNVFIIHLKPSEDMILWIEKYDYAHAEIKKMISRNPNLWTIEFDTTIIKPQVFYNTLKLDTTIIQFEFDKRLSIRK